MDKVKTLFEELKKEYSVIVSPTRYEVMRVAFLVVLFSIFFALSIAGVDYIIGILVNNILFN